MWYKVRYTGLVPRLYRLSKSGNENVHSFPDETSADTIHVDQRQSMLQTWLKTSIVALKLSLPLELVP